MKDDPSPLFIPTLSCLLWVPVMTNLCVCVCVCARARVCVWLCVCVCVLFKRGILMHYVRLCPRLFIQQHSMWSPPCIQLLHTWSPLVCVHFTLTDHSYGSVDSAVLASVPTVCDIQLFLALCSPSCCRKSFQIIVCALRLHWFTKTNNCVRRMQQLRNQSETGKLGRNTDGRKRHKEKATIFQQILKYLKI